MDNTGLELPYWLKANRAYPLNTGEKRFVDGGALEGFVRQGGAASPRVASNPPVFVTHLHYVVRER